MLRRDILAGGRSPAFFGVNISGPEFPIANARYGRVTEDDARYLRRVGCRIVRLPESAEKLFPTLSSATADATEMGLLKADIDILAKYGISTIVDLHNFGRWATNYSSDGYPGQSGDILGGSNYTSAVFVAQWETISTALKGRRGLAGYGLMNEPHDMAGTNKIPGPNAGGYAGRTGVDWFVINSAVATPLAAAGPTTFWDNDAFTLTSGSGFGGILIQVTTANAQHTFSYYARTASGTESHQVTSDSVDIGGGAKTATTSWTRFSGTWTPTAAAHQIGAVHLGSTTLQLANFQLETGGSATTYVPHPLQPIAQAAITAIGAIDAVTPIYVCGYQYGSAYNWPAINNQMKFTTVGNPIFYEAHEYPDGAGTYTSSYDSLGFSASSMSSRLTDYLASASTNKFLGEFGVPVDNDSRYATLLDNGMHAAYLAKVRGCQWFYGVKGTQDTGRLNIAPRGNSGVLPPIAQRLLQRAA